MKASDLQAAFVRRREMDEERTERLAAVDRYYDHWGKVNTRYENWTAPEYYKKAGEKLEQKKKAADAEQQLGVRRSKLRDLFKEEKFIWEQEIRERERPRSRKLRASTNTLTKVDENLKQRENIKRKLDIEAKLYGRWRHGVDDDNLLFESKTTNETLAKLNWLDKQVDDQLTREREAAEAEQRQLRLQEELHQTELVQRDRQKLREQEIKEISALQQRHLNEIKERQSESETLRAEERCDRSIMDEMDKELELLKDSLMLARISEEMPQAHNLSKIKVLIRKRSELFRNQIKLAISVLERVRAYASKRELVDSLRDKYKGQLEDEMMAVARVDAMYESEAKFSLQRCEAAWQAQLLQRYDELRQLLLDEQCHVSTKLNDNLQRQSDLIEIRSTHLSSIETSNVKLKQLMKEEEESPRGTNPDAPLTERSEQRPSADAVSQASHGRRSPTRVSNSFHNLNLDRGESMHGSLAPPTTQSRQCSPRPHLNSSINAHVVDNAHAPTSLPSHGGSPRSQLPRSSSSCNNLNMDATSLKSVQLQPSLSRRSNTATATGLPQLTSSFTNLNMDVWKDLPAGRGVLRSPSSALSQRSVVTADNAERPKFARKRVAWT